MACLLSGGSKQSRFLFLVSAIFFFFLVGRKQVKQGPCPRHPEEAAIALQEEARGGPRKSQLDLLSSFAADFLGSGPSGVPERSCQRQQVYPARRCDQESRLLGLGMSEGYRPGRACCSSFKPQLAPLCSDNHYQPGITGPVRTQRRPRRGE